MEIDLVGVAHRAVDLDRRLRRQHRGVGRGELGVADMDRRAGVAVIERISRAPQYRPGELQRHRDAGEVMLDRLERADRLAELLTVLRIFGGECEHPLARADKLRRRHQRGEIEHYRVGLGALHREQPPQGIGALQPFASRRAAEHQPGLIGIRHPRIDRMRQRDLQLARRDRRKLRLVRYQARRDQGGIDDRLRYVGAAQFDRDQRRFDQPQPEAALRLRHDQPGQPHLDQPAPDRRVAPAFGIEAPQHLGAVRALEEGAHAVAQLDLVLGEREVHQPAPMRGRPSSRSAMMLRWISFDPA